MKGAGAAEVEMKFLDISAFGLSTGGDITCPVFVRYKTGIFVAKSKTIPYFTGQLATLTVS